MKLILASEFSVSAAKIVALLENEPLLGNKVLFIDTAARGEGWTPDPAADIKPLEDAGFVFTSYDIAGKSEDDVRRAMQDAAIIYVCGGNTFYLLEHMKKCNFGALIKERLTQGAIYMGESAGSMVCTPDISYVDVMDNPKLANLDNTKALGLVDFLIVPHLDHADLGMAAREIVSTYNGTLPLIALYDHQLLFVRDKVVTVL